MMRDAQLEGCKRAMEDIGYQLTMATRGAASHDHYYAFVMTSSLDGPEEVDVLRIFKATGNGAVYHYLAKNWTAKENELAAEILGLDKRTVTRLNGTQLVVTLDQWNSPATAFHVVEIDNPVIVDLVEESDSDDSQ